jgi:succinate-semialdehyde dehydrogenase / glutarate-semialdehyde dehydrogenase
VKGAKVVRRQAVRARRHLFFEPTVPTDVTTDIVVTKEETFGPGVLVYRFKTDARPRRFSAV